MQLKTLTVKNFRALEDVQVDFDSRVNVIVGPNAIGKTTLLEAIRLSKAVLAPRTQSETTQTLFSLGLAVPHNPQQLIWEAACSERDRPVEIRCRYELSEREFLDIENGLPQIATNMIQAQMGQQFANPAVLTAFLSSEGGRNSLADAQKQLRSALGAAQSAGRVCRLDLTFDFAARRLNSGYPYEALFFSFLDQRHPPNRSVFSYFPADRALPSGEQPVQLGAADAGAQLESHNSQPQTKYTRLKNTIFNALVTSDEERKALINDFTRIFEGILKGRKLLAPGVNQYGLLTIPIEDTETGKTFSIDALSSGEKGLILTFLLINRSVAQDGIILFDEPELHLNPAICRDILTFLVDAYAKPKNMQAIICSHSPEILAGALDRDECSLFHLVSGTLLTKVRRRDEDVVTDALRRLGTSVSEDLLYKATIFVEGEEDVELLGVGFSQLLRRYNLIDLGGRKQVEKQIELLQEAEKKGETLTPKYFIFDRDEAPSDIKSSTAVKVLQWSRRCLENYLIDIDVLTDLLMDAEIVRTPFANQGEVTKKLKELAMLQIDDFVAKRVYERFGFESPGLRTTEIEGKSLEDMAVILWQRLAKVRDQVTILDESGWQMKFRNECSTARKELESVWEIKWREDCDGKRLFRDLYRSVQFRVSLRSLKKRVISAMRSSTPTSENWRAVESLLKGLLDSKQSG